MIETNSNSENSKPKAGSDAAGSPQFNVVRAVKDQTGRVWLEISDGTCSAYILRSDLIGDSSAAFKILERQGIAILNPKTQTQIRIQAQTITQVAETARMAVRPGWCGSAYVMPDKTVLTPTGGRADAIIVQFDANPKCKRSQDGLAGYVKAFESLVKGQSLPTTSILLSLAGTLLNLVSATRWSVGNTGFDNVGAHNSGKTQNLAAAGATWGDDPLVKRGYADTWSGTVAATMARVNRWNDGSGGFDETSTSTLKGATKAGTAIDLATKVMMLSDGAERNRYGDLAEAQPSRFIYLSTGNSAVADTIEGRQEVIDAHSSRLITLRLDRFAGHGIFDSIPPGFATAAGAGNALDLARQLHHGWLGLKFVEKLVGARAKDEAGLIRRIGRYMDEVYARIQRGASAPPMDRIWRPLALAYAAGRLAKNWGLLPNSWGNFLVATTRIYDLAVRSFGNTQAAAPVTDPLDDLKAYFKTTPLIDIRKAKSKMSKQQVEVAPGFLSKQHKTGQFEALISAKRFIKVFPNHNAILTSLIAARKLTVEKNKRVVYRSIRGVGERDRAYAILVKRVKTKNGVFETRLA